MTILEQIINNSVNVVSQNHNVNSITIETAQVDAAISRLAGGRTWDAAEYGMTLEQVQQAFAAANTPEARAQVEETIRLRAIRRAGLDTSNSRVNAMFAGRPAWHGLGIVVDKAATSAEAIRYAGLDWKVTKKENFFLHNGSQICNPESFSIVREDTGAFLGSVGSRYAPIQNSEGFGFLDGVLSDFGARYETAGSIYGGRRVWMLAKLPKQSFELEGGDVTESYVLFSNCHDGSGAAWCFPTTVRVECANTLRIASGSRTNGLWIRHTGKVATKISAAKEALGIAVASIETYKENAEIMQASKCDPTNFFNKVLDQVLDVTEADMKTGAVALAAALDVAEEDRLKKVEAIELEMKKRSNILEDIFDRYESDRCRPRGTVWGAFNAVTEHADHSKPARESKDAQTRASRRFESILTGDADDLKQIAYVQAMEYTN